MDLYEIALQVGNAGAYNCTPERPLTKRKFNPLRGNCRFIATMVAPQEGLRPFASSAGK
jgi:hypothetical protein